MARVCQNCGKGVMTGSKVARARQELLYRSPKVFKPNLQVARILQPDGTKRKMLLCAKCVRMVKEFTSMQLSQATKVAAKPSKTDNPK